MPIIPDHDLLALIGQGAYGQVWLARNRMGTLRAVKVVYRDQFQQARPYERVLQGIRRYEPISRAHEGLVDVLHLGENSSAGYFYYVMEVADDAGPPAAAGPAPEAANGTAGYVPHTLHLRLKREGRLPVGECLRLGIALTEALEFLHQGGLIHRDLKPSNVVFVGGVPKLADIDLVTLADEPHSWVGTDGFIPPEGPGEVRGDVYSFGKLLYEMATGNDRHEFPNPPTIGVSEGDGRVLAELNQVILRACDPEAPRRHASAEELRQDLLLLAAGKSVRRLRVLERRMARVKRIGVAALAAGVVVGAVSVWQYRQAEAMERLAGESRDRLVRLHVATAVRLMDEGDLMASLPWLVEALRLEQGDPEAGGSPSPADRGGAAAMSQTGGHGNPRRADQPLRAQPRWPPVPDRERRWHRAGVGHGDGRTGNAAPAPRQAHLPRHLQPGRSAVDHRQRRRDRADLGCGQRGAVDAAVGPS
ncbi:MAG: serine/threonine protein kinase [Verrucomicrobia bacterium]|nr:serine/threonine protein kinase [Verrucomicrobiota bacterium]